MNTKRIILTLLASLLNGSLLAQSTPSYELPPISYSKTKGANAVNRLRASLAKNPLPERQPHLALKEILKRLEIPASSQCLVFSKTSKQRTLITPSNPRAIYFNDDLYVGYVPGGLIEIAATDDPTGIMFYTFDPMSPVKQADISRDNSCLTCHSNSQTQDIPGLMVRSVETDQDGQPVLQLGSAFINASSPLPERWGGWYVSGTHGELTHMGNRITKKISDGNFQTPPPQAGQNIKDLSPFFDVKKYLAPTSDIVALMVMEHQLELHNTLHAARIQYLQSVYLHRSLHPGTSPTTSQHVTNLIDSSAQKILNQLLFHDEAALPVDGIEGSPSFVTDFLSQAKRSKRGHSLRDLRLQKRMFKYRCSYLIHCQAFSQLPDPIKIKILTRLHKHLTSDTQDPTLPLLSSRERTRIHEILIETHDDYFKIVKDLPLYLEVKKR